MRISRPSALLLAGTLLLPFVRAADPAFDPWVEAVTTEAMRADPAGATEVQYFTGAEQDAADRQLTPFTKAYRAERLAVAKKVLAELARFDHRKLDESQRVSAAILEWQFNEDVKADAFTDHKFIFHQFRGLHVRLVNFLSQTHPIRNRRDIENYLARLELVAGQMDEGIAQARDAGTRGFLMPDFITRSALGQFDRFLADAPPKNVLVTSLAERAAKLPEVSAADRAAFVAAAEKIVTASVIPAFQRARALLQEQLPRTNDHAGLCWLPGGEAAYAFFLGHYTTTSLTPQEVHALGLQEVARIEARMDGLFKQLGYPEGSIQDRMKQLEAKLQPPADPDPRPALLARYDEILADAVKRSQALFDLQPKAPCVVKREPPFTEKTAAAHYNAPARDGSRPGTFWAPLPGPAFRLVGMKTLVYHEAIPGHHFQIALMQEMPGLPRFRQDRIFGGNSAHSEGWALYAENLAAESGWYDGDPVGLLGQLNDELFRARRLVVDTGIHAMKWTRQQALDYGLPVDNPVAEVERYVVFPGQACSYKIGMLKLIALRAKAQSALGPKFSLKEFHNTVLRTGSVPLVVLEQVIDGWIAATK
jgi:uncharacterized protein (DUF885 family)